MLERVLFTFAIFSLSTSSAQSQQPIKVLEPRITIESELASEQKHTYEFSLTSGQYANVIVGQRGIDVVIRSLGIKGNQIAEFDSEIRLKGEETVELIAEAAGVYKLEVESKNKAAPAGRYEIRLAEVRVATERDRSLEEARNLSRESNRLLGEDEVSKARPLAERSLAIREGVLGPDHIEVASIVNTLANIHYQLDDFHNAEILFERALAIREKTLSPDHPDLADSLAGLALASYMEGKYYKVKPLYYRAIEIKERAFGPDHPEVARSLLRLANIFYHSSDYVNAELLYRRCLTIAEKSLAENDPMFAKALSSLGNLYVELGDYVKAEPMLQRSLKILEKSYGPDSRMVATDLIRIGKLYSDMAEYAKAILFFQRALRIMDPNENGTQVALTNLGQAYFRQGEYAKAEPLFQQALAKKEEIFGQEQTGVAFGLICLADLYLAQGDYVRAEPLYHRGLAIYEKLVGSDHLDLAETLKGLAILYWAKGEIAQSLAYQTRVNSILERNINYNLVIGSERQKLAYLASMSGETDRTLSLQIRAAPENRNAQLLAATAVLQRKGRVLDLMTDTLAALRQRSSAEDQIQIEQLNELTSQLATLVLDGPQETSLAEHQQKTKTVEGEREKLENEISRRSAGFYQPLNPVTLAAVQTAIPPGAAFIEFAIYHPFDPKTAFHSKAFGEPHYVAYIFRPRAEVRWKELGKMKTIDDAIDAFRQAFRDPKRNDVKKLARVVDEMVMQPIRPLLGDATQLLISPDGSLNLIPFEALVDEQNRYLVERFSNTYITSGRDLLRMQIARDSQSSTVVFADPLFGEPEMIAEAKTEPQKSQSISAKRRSITTGSNLSDVYFPPLAGTAQEARAIKSLFTEATVLSGKQATEASLKRVSAPRILHIATHGFFLTDTFSSNSSGEPTRSISANAKIENPLLRSGLALAGANIHKSSGDDGVLTALEASGLNLWGTKLVTLSACDTGVGDVKNGEGVYGLRRAFVLAGTETLVMSLWPVSDYVTREMMTSYYKGLKEGLGRGEALRQVQLSMLKRKGREHPFYWASFIQSGEWANLNGER